MMVFKVTGHEPIVENYIVMKRIDFEIFVSNYRLATFKDRNEIFTYYNGIQVVQEYEPRVKK